MHVHATLQDTCACHGLEEEAATRFESFTGEACRWAHAGLLAQARAVAKEQEAERQACDRADCWHGRARIIPASCQAETLTLAS